MMTFTRSVLGFFASKWVFGILALSCLFAGYWFFVRSSGTAYQFIPVTQGPITETVSVTGNTTPAKSVSLGFQNAGTIARVNYNLGDTVSAGAVIAELTTANLSAALEQAQANLAVAEANLASLLAGTRPEQLAIDQDAVVQDKAALTNAISNAYAVADGAVHTNADQLFTNPRTSGAALAFTVSGMTLADTVVRERVALEPVLTAWSAQVYGSAANANDPVASATQAVRNLSQVSAFLNDAASILTNVQPTGSLTAATLSSYEASIATARTSVSAALTALTTAQTALVGAEGALALAQAGPTAENIAAQKAQVEQAQDGVASAAANLQAAEIVAPIGGTITQLDAKVGQVASPGTPLVSIIGAGGFEVDAGVSEIDVAKLSVGDAVSMTLDAFPNETFTGSVFYIAPAQTNTQGVITYLIKVSFDKPDPRLKSGLTANVAIETKHEDNALILPQYAILQNDSGTFVKTIIGKIATTTPVTLGIQDQEGNVEILSGVTLGEQVINIGLKAQ